MKLLTESCELSAPLAQRLARVSTVFEGQLRSDVAAVDSLTRHVERYRGKMLRPILVVIAGWTVRPPSDDAGEIERQLDTVAAVAEMIHMATLVHDDVLDEAELRRGGVTVNSLRGNETAVMLGDYLIASAFHLCSSLALPWLNSALGVTTTQLCSGEILQLTHRGNMSLDEATYFEIIRLKTAVLSGACCSLAGRIVGANAAQIAALHRYGEELGMAFQIQDDLLDLVGDEETVGKTLGIDLQKGKLTLPIVMHLARVDEVARAQTLQAIQGCDRRALRVLVTESGALQAAREKALGRVVAAKRQLAQLPSGAATELLARIADATVERAH